ncbi:organic cation transporter protein-like [Haliotis rufescens]|uniref:organic cation transporter protein-like n=1 Tax=Haliotis rufescens TaxID=6454 RepID=UPI00201E78EF|nr:organic cation transporter protein-like [Haliotis rufescens]
MWFSNPAPHPPPSVNKDDVAVETRLKHQGYRGDSKMKFEDIVKILGDFGSYQKKLYFLLCIPTISIGMQTIMTVFSLGVPHHRLMPESARWLLSKQKYEEADQILRHAAKVNKATLPSDMFSENMQEQKTEEPLWQMFKRPALVIRSLVLFLNWFVASIGFYGLGLNVANLGGSVYTNLFIAALTELAGHASCLVLLNRVGRKSFHCFVMILGGLCCTATILPELYGNGSLNWLTIALALTGQGFVVASFDIIWLYSSELFPTVIRSSALAVANIFARVGGIISPYIAGLALVISGDFGRIVPLIIIGTSMIVAGLAALLLPETVNNPLPDNIDDAWRMQRRRHSDDTGADFIDSHGDEIVILRPVETQQAVRNNGVSTSANRTLEVL